MAKIYAPNKQYSGISASVAFAKGVGETDNPALIDWFKGHGYAVEDEDTQQENQVPDEDTPEKKTRKKKTEPEGEDAEQEV